MIIGCSILAVILAAIPALLFLGNLPLFTLENAAEDGDSEEANNLSDALISVLIPARDEHNSIEACIRSALASEGVKIEVLVLDDNSTDQTPEIVSSIAKEDQRVRCLKGQPLPDGWNGKQFACSQLASAAHGTRLVFIDADVRLDSRALFRLAAYQDAHRVDLLSAFPHQETGTLLEKLLIPMMHVILLGYLPLQKMREGPDPAFAAGCGQLFMTTKDSYVKAGTHEAVKNSRHDGLKLPRAYRTSGLMTDVIDGTHLASCRMYHSASEVIRGLLKNANEGIANAKLILPFSILLLGAAVLPIVMLILSLREGSATGMVLSCLAVVLGHLPRAIGAVKFQQSWLGVILHSMATLIFVTLQWIAFGMGLTGHSVAWRGRTNS